MNFKSIIFFIITISTVLFPAEFYKLSELEHNGAKQDTAIWVQNPVPDKNMEPDETIEIDISYSFDWRPDSIEFYSITVAVTNTSAVSPVYSATFNQSTNRIRIVTKPDIYGHAYIAYTANTSLGSATDEFLLRVEKTGLLWLPLSGQYDILPENCFGTLAGEWKAAAVFDLGSSECFLDCIEFGYGLDGTADWEIVYFNELPTDSVINGLSGIKTFKGGYSTFIEDLNKTLTGKIAVVFNTTSNFMAMEPSGDSDNTWIYPVGEDSLWVHPEDISADYAGAWYIRLYVLDPTGIEEVITTGKTPCLLDNYPNPFNNETVIHWSMKNPGNAVIKVYNSKGEFVRDMADRSYGAGKHSIIFDSAGLNSGVYYYELLIDGIRAGSNRMLYLK